MTPEELQRAMDFVVEHQARFAAALEEEREERVKQWKLDQPRIARVEAAVARLGEHEVTLLKILDIQSRRLDRHDQEFKTLHQEAERRHEEAMARLDRIHDRLTDKK